MKVTLEGLARQVGMQIHLPSDWFGLTLNGMPLIKRPNSCDKKREEPLVGSTIPNNSLLELVLYGTSGRPHVLYVTTNLSCIAKRSSGFAADSIVKSLG